MIHWFSKEWAQLGLQQDFLEDFGFVEGKKQTGLWGVSVRHQI